MEEMKLKRKIAEILGVDVILEVEAKGIMLDVHVLQEANIKFNIIEDVLKEKLKCDFVGCKEWKE